MRRLLPILFLFGSLMGPVSSVTASPNRASVVAHGVQLSLDVAPGIYRRDALITVRVSLRNVSHRTIWESPMVVEFCTRVDFLVETLNDQGQQLFPLPPAPGPVPPCPAPLPYPLHPGQTVSHQVRVVLLSDRLQATTNVNTLSGTRNYQGVELKTPVITVRLRSAGAPSVTVRTLDHTVAVVSKPRGASGPLLYEQWSDCGASVTRVLSWTGAEGNTVDAGCLHPHEWHLVAGWLNYPVAVLDVIPSIPPASVVATPPFSAVPYTVHAGQVLEVMFLLLGPGEEVARADPAYLRLVDASSVGAEPVRYDWRWQAIAAGDTQIVLQRRLPSGQQAVIRVHIMP